MDNNSDRHLLTRSELIGLLRLSQSQVDWLIKTAQLRPILICNEERFDSKDVTQLIETYKIIQRRNKNDSCHRYS
jgi:hypothetical protein